MKNQDFFDDMDDAFEQIMKSGTVPSNINRRINKESLFEEKIDYLKIAIKSASDMELDFLIENLDYLINTMMQNEKVKRDFEYRKTLKKGY